MKKRKLEEAEAGENQSAPKRKNQSAKQAADGGLTADSDTAEEEEEEQKENEGDEENKDKKAKTTSRPESIKSE